MDVNYPFQGSYQIDEAFVTSRLETRTKEFVVYASHSVFKTEGHNESDFFLRVCTIPTLLVDIRHR